MGVLRMSYALLAVTGLFTFLVRGDARADVARGQALSEQWCAECHGVRQGMSSGNPKAPTFLAIALEPSATQYSLRTFLRTPHYTMPNFILKPHDIDDS